MHCLKNIEFIEENIFERIQNIREKVHLDYASHMEIEELNELESILQDSKNEFQSEFWM